MKKGVGGAGGALSNKAIIIWQHSASNSAFPCGENIKRFFSSAAGQLNFDSEKLKLGVQFFFFWSKN